MDWKEIDKIPVPQTARALNHKESSELQNELIRALFGETSQEETVLLYLAENWANFFGGAAARSAPMAIHDGALLVFCSSASARQDLQLRFPRLQKEVQSRFSTDIRTLRFEQLSKAPEPTRKSEEPAEEDTDTVKRGEDPLITDIRRILGL